MVCMDFSHVDIPVEYIDRTLLVVTVIVYPAIISVCYLAVRRCDS
jgi:hypothetical protein